MTFVIAIKNASRNIVLASPADNEVSWFYMCGGRGYHMSGLGTDNDERPNVITRHSDHVESLRAAGQIPTGQVTLRPNWKKDYSQMLKNYINQ